MHQSHDHPSAGQGQFSWKWQDAIKCCILFLAPPKIPLPLPLMAAIGSGSKTPTGGNGNFPPGAKTSRGDQSGLGTNLHYHENSDLES